LCYIISNSPNPPAPFPEREGGEIIGTPPSPFRGGGGGRGALIANRYDLPYTGKNFLPALFSQNSPENNREISGIEKQSPLIPTFR